MAKLTKSAQNLHHNVPPDWYESSVKINLLQKFWHWRRFIAIDRFSEKVSGDILDIGSADGYFTAEIARTTGCSNIYGIDVLPSSVAYAKNRYRSDPRFHFSLGDGHKLKFPATRFSAVYCLEAMEHVFNPAQVLKEIKRVLKPGGYTVILVPSENWLFSRTVWPMWLRWRGRIWADTHLSFFSGNKLPDLLTKAGFVNVETHRFLLGMLLLVKARKIRP